MSSIEPPITRRSIERSLFILAAALAVIVVRGVSAASSIDPHSAAFVAWAGSAAIRLRTVEAGGEDDGLAPLCDSVGRAPVVALGEPGHGAHEPLALRNRLYSYLVEHCGFTAIALETS